MGCDIHIWAEVKQDNGTWKKVGRVFDNPYWKEGDEIEEETYDDGDTYYFGPKTDEPYRERNYNLFAVLANVRNGYGFAGTPTGYGFEPIVLPRGIPKDASPEYKQKVAYWNGGGHSHSWLTLRELQEFPWHNKHTIIYGIVPEERYLHRRTTGEEYTTYSGGIRGPRIITLPKHMYDAITKEKLDTLKAEGNIIYVRDQWKESYKEAVDSRFFEQTIPSLQALGKPDDVRIVFFFDN